jgi:DNA-directed RNA polymerase specialized sigma24 family protein
MRWRRSIRDRHGSSNYAFFGGFSVEETAEALDVSVRTVINDWNTARAWLRGELTKQGRDGR